MVLGVLGFSVCVAFDPRHMTMEKEWQGSKERQGVKPAAESDKDGAIPKELVTVVEAYEPLKSMVHRTDIRQKLE